MVHSQCSAVKKLIITAGSSSLISAGRQRPREKDPGRRRLKTKDDQASVRIKFGSRALITLAWAKDSCCPKWGDKAHVLQAQHTQRVFAIGPCGRAVAAKLPPRRSFIIKPDVFLDVGVALSSSRLISMCGVNKSVGYARKLRFQPTPLHRKLRRCWI